MYTLCHQVGNFGAKILIQGSSSYHLWGFSLTTEFKKLEEITNRCNKNMIQDNNSLTHIGSNQLGNNTAVEPRDPKSLYLFVELYTGLLEGMRAGRWQITEGGAYTRQGTVPLHRIGALFIVGVTLFSVPCHFISLFSIYLSQPSARTSIPAGPFMYPKRWLSTWSWTNINRTPTFS